LLLDQLGESRKKQISIEELMLFVENGNSLIYEDLDMDKYPGLKAIKECDKMGYFGVWCENSGKKFLKNLLIFILDGKRIEVSVVQKFGASIRLMANKFHVKGLRVKYAKDGDYEFLLDPALFNQKPPRVKKSKQ
jgi:hypothetical protein